jgi:hypothetical protein
LTFADGRAIRRFSVPIVNDRRNERTETVNLRLTTPQGGATLSLPKTATLKILDND